MRAPADGYTLLLIPSSVTANATLYKNVNFRMKALTKISYNLVRAEGIEPSRAIAQRIFVPATAFAAATDGVCGLDYTFAVA